GSIAALHGFWMEPFEQRAVAHEGRDHALIEGSLEAPVLHFAKRVENADHGHLGVLRLLTGTPANSGPIAPAVSPHVSAIGAFARTPRPSASRALTTRDGRRTLAIDLDDQDLPVAVRGRGLLEERAGPAPNGVENAEDRSLARPPGAEGLEGLSRR